MNPGDNVWFMGDLHGQFRYVALWNDMVQNSTLIQVGDFGVGFDRQGRVLPDAEDTSSRPSTIEKLALLSHYLEQRGNRLLVVRGNHDDPSWFDNFEIGKSITLLQDEQTVVTPCGLRVFVIGGGISLDRTEREEGRSYWPAEKFTWSGALPAERVDCVVTHAAGLFGDFELDVPIVNTYVGIEAMQGGDLLSELIEERSQHEGLMLTLRERDLGPTQWFYGHYHTSKVTEHHGIRFHCLNAAVGRRTPECKSWNGKRIQFQ